MAYDHMLPQHISHNLGNANASLFGKGLEPLKDILLNQEKEVP